MRSERSNVQEYVYRYKHKTIVNTKGELGNNNNKSNEKELKQLTQCKLYMLIIDIIIVVVVGVVVFIVVRRQACIACVVAGDWPHASLIIALSAGDDWFVCGFGRYGAGKKYRLIIFIDSGVYGRGYSYHGIVPFKGRRL